MNIWTIALLIAAALGCSHKDDHDSVPPKEDSRFEQLKTLFAQYEGTAAALADPADGWIEKGCDGMIWSARYGIVEPGKVKITAAEYPDAPGKFGRRPAPWCWAKEGADAGMKQESASTWSRDMAIAGLFPYAFLTGQRDILERHAAYVQAHNWAAGDPLADGRTLYTPQMVGMLFKTIHGMGGAANVNELWPSIYPAGLTDYELHLQVSEIFLRGRVADALADPDNRPQANAPADFALTVSNTMFQRLQEAAAAEPTDPFYSFVLGEYTGDQTHTLDLLLDPAMPMAHYVRCDGDQQKCVLAQWLYVAHLTLQAFEPKK